MKSYDAPQKFIFSEYLRARLPANCAAAVGYLAWHDLVTCSQGSAHGSIKVGYGFAGNLETIQKTGIIKL
jgi:hypothetical protein